MFFFINLLDFYRSLNRHSRIIGPHLASRYLYLFIDEFQDTDRVQKIIVQELIPYLGRLLVVGDRKQSIYAFRGAEDSILTEIARDNGVSVILLSASRRPTKPLLEVQNVLFKDMGRRYDVLKDLLTLAEDTREPNDDIVPFQFILMEKSRREGRIIRAIKLVNGLLGRQIDHKEDGIRNIKYKDICILFRSNNFLDEYASQFRAAGIPIVVELGGTFFRKPEIVGCYYMLQAILKYPNDVALDLALETPFLPIRPLSRSYLRHDHTSYPLCDWLASDPRVRRWHDGMMRIRSRAKIDLVPQLLQELYDFTKIREFYAKEGNIQAVANLELLITWAREQMHSEALTLQQLADRMQTAMLTGEKMDEADIGGEGEVNSVTFSTIHSAKGLEYPIVIIPELQRPLFSDFNSPTFFDIPGWGLDVSLPGGIGRSSRFHEFLDQYIEAVYKEEARVFYVAVTRAQNAVILISGGLWKIANFKSAYWSWKDEVLCAHSALSRLGPKKVLFTH